MSPPDDALFEEVAKTPGEQMAKAARRADGLTPEEEQGQRRVDRARFRKTLRKARATSVWTLYVLGVVVALAVLTLFLTLLWQYGSNLVNDPAKATDAVSGLLQFLFGVFVTLGAELLVRRSSDGGDND